MWKHTAAQGIAEEDALKKGMEEKSKEFQPGSQVNSARLSAAMAKLQTWFASLKPKRFPLTLVRMDKTALVELIGRYKADPESVYSTWFINGEERMKAFRAIRRGVKNTVDAIVHGTFGNDFKGSPLSSRIVSSFSTHSRCLM